LFSFPQLALAAALDRPDFGGCAIARDNTIASFFNISANSVSRRLIRSLEAPMLSAATT
jgi:hypothetical protein